MAVTILFLVLFAVQWLGNLYKATRIKDHDDGVFFAALATIFLVAEIAGILYLAGGI